MREAARLSRLQREAVDVPVEAKPTGERLRRVVSDRRHNEGRLYEFDRIVHLPGSPMSEPISLGRQASKYDISVLITGASGTGKELLGARHPLQLLARRKGLRGRELRRASR